MSKKIVFSFPGGRGTEVPLLYFGAKYYEDMDYEKRFVEYPASGHDFETVYENAKAILESYDLEEYDDIVFVAKSKGTVVACKLKEELKVNASLVLFTPLADTLPFIKGDNQIVLVAASNNDRHLESEILCNLCEREKVPYYIEPNVGHRMEVRNDLEKNLQTILNVIGRLER